MNSTAKRKETDPLASAKRQGQAQFDSIKEMVRALEKCDGCSTDHDDAEQTIHEDALSVQVRSGWYAPSASQEDREPREYEILLCTGGPACRIVGKLGEHNEPESATIEVQDWFQPWTAIRPIVGYSGKGKARVADYDSEPILLAYARCFYFGE